MAGDISSAGPGISYKALFTRGALYFAVLLIAILLLFFFFKYQEFTRQQEEKKRLEALRLELVVTSLNQDLQSVVSDLHRLAYSRLMMDYIVRPTRDSRQRLESEFGNLAIHTGHYDQVRFLNLNGQELIRVNYHDGNIENVSPAQLQNKADRYYFKNAFDLSRGEIYLSPCDLNIENGEIEIPYKPMIRFAMPLYTTYQEGPVGVLVLNYLASRLFEHFEREMEGSWGEPMIINENGFWLLSANSEDEWGFMWGDYPKFQGRYPASWPAILSGILGQVTTEEGVFTFNTIDTQTFSQREYTRDACYIWKLITWVEPGKLGFSPLSVMYNSRVWLLMLVFAVGALSWLIAWLRVANLMAYRTLSTNEKRSRNLFENMEDGYALMQAIYNEQGRPVDYVCLEVNPACEVMFGISRQKVIGNKMSEALPKLDQHWISAFDSAATTGQSVRSNQTIECFGGHFEIAVASPEPGLVAVFYYDITERKRAEKQLQQAAVVFDNTAEAIIVTDADKKIMTVNKSFTDITGYKSEEVVGQSPGVYKSGRHDKAFYQRFWDTLTSTGYWQGEIWNTRKNGEHFPAWENVSAVRDENGSIVQYVAVMSDISSLKKAEERLAQLAHHDVLTGLANRYVFSSHLEQALKRAQRNNSKVALLFLDLDRFKLVNDTYGHDAGDLLLQEVANRLKQCVRDEDLVARLGGDEFAVVLEEVTQLGDIVPLVEKIIESVAQSIVLPIGDITTSTSVGISTYPDDAENSRDLAKAADIAMYRAKACGRNTFAFYTAELTALAEQKILIEQELRQAIARNELLLFFQPQFDLNTDKVSGVEALLRWQHPTKGLLLPADFLWVAHESSLMEAIGGWVLKQSFHQAFQWHRQGLAFIRLGINLSVRQLMQDNLVTLIADSMDRYQLTPESIQLQIEITEEVLQAGSKILENIDRIKQLGISVAIDDFGTGYSSLSQLVELPVDSLKVCQSFLLTTPDGVGKKGIISAIVSMGHSLGLRIIAEGVENMAQLQLLKELKCDEAQGFFLGKPMSADQIEALLKS